MTGEQIMQMDSQYVAHTYGRFPAAIVSGQGAVCYSADGKRYIDFTSGIGVNSLGFADPGWAEAVYKQLTSLQHISNLYYTEPCAQLARTLCQRTGCQKVFFANSGAESNEGMIKCARKYSHDKYGAGRATVLSLKNSFHGRTITTLSATGQEVFHQNFFPFTEGFAFAEAGNWADTEEKLRGDVCAVLIELVQGEGGVLPLDLEYVQKLNAKCRERDILLLVDEVQTGVGRTGTLYAYQQFGITPDILSSAKGLGGGLPLGAVLFFDKTKDTLAPGDHATTFGGNPAVCAGANYVLSRMDEAFLRQVTEKGQYLREKIGAMPHVEGVDGLGLMLGVRLNGVAAKDVVMAGVERGALFLTAKAKLRLLPPLTINTSEMDAGLKILYDILKAV